MTNNPVLRPEVWIAPTLAAVACLALLLWAVIKVIRAPHLSVLLRLGLLLLAIAVPYLGAIVAALTARQQRRVLPER
ncbi:hypothetical protein GCM10009670_30200 [Citricoccus alkalitolerans]